MRIIDLVLCSGPWKGSERINCVHGMLVKVGCRNHSKPVKDITVP